MTFGVTEPAATAAAASPVVIVIIIARARPRAGKPAFLVSRAIVTSVVIIVIARPRATPVVVISTAGGAFALLPAPTSSLRVPGAIAEPATMVAAAAPVDIVIVITRSRPRAGKPAFLVARAVITSVVIIVIT